VSGRPKGGYRLRDGTKVPGVTTIVSRFKDSGGLIRWAYKCGVDGIDIDKARDNAAEAGTIAHDMIDAWVHGRDWEPDVNTSAEMLEKAQKGFEGFLSWAASTHLDVVETEVSLVSERHRFGGTIDGIGRLNGQTVLLDWKSSNRIYADYIVQVAAYVKLLEECRRDRITGIHLLRVGKEWGDFHHHSWPVEVAELGWRAFTHQRQLYDLDKPLKAAVGA
jgi:hypothetical protein